MSYINNILNTRTNISITMSSDGEIESITEAMSTVDLNKKKGKPKSSSSVNKECKKALVETIDAIATNHKVISSLDDNNLMVIELLSNIHQIVGDMSKKFDEVLNIGLKKPRIAPVNTKAKSKPIKEESKSPPKKNANSVVKTEPIVSTINKNHSKPIKNIMIYFKTKYQEDDTLFNDVLEENQANALFEQHKADIASKKEGAVRKKAKATLLYKTLTKAQKSKIRDKMINEDERSNINTNDELAEESE
jgi:hypothetical protein